MYEIMLENLLIGDLYFVKYLTPEFDVLKKSQEFSGIASATVIVTAMAMKGNEELGMRNEDLRDSVTTHIPHPSLFYTDLNSAHTALVREKRKRFRYIFTDPCTG